MCIHLCVNVSMCLHVSVSMYKCVCGVFGCECVNVCSVQNDMMEFSGKWMKLKKIIFTEIIQIQKDKFGII